MTFNTPQIKNSYQQRDFTNPTLQAIMLAIIVVIFSWFIVKPKLADYTTTRNTLKTAQAKLKQSQEDQKNLNELIAKLRDSKDDVALIDEALPLQGRVSKSNVLMQNLVQSSGMSLSQLSTDDTSKIVSAGDKEGLADPFSKPRKLHTITMTTTLTGTMDQFKNLLELIETSSRVLDVESMDILGGDQQIKFRLIVKAYSFEGGAVTQGVKNAK